jgi:hypothetical protein
MYRWVVAGGIAYVSDIFGNKAYLEGRMSVLDNPDVRTRPDNTPTDNLLALPEC